MNIFGTLGSRESIASQSLEWLIGGDLLCVNTEYRHFWKAPESTILGVDPNLAINYCHLVGRFGSFMYITI